MSTSVVSLLAVTVALFGAAAALTCYENDNNGNTYERTNDEWKYCSMIPLTGESGAGRLAGVSAATENLAPYEATFGQNSKLYKVLAMCTLEKYDFHAINPAFGPAPEFMFRCFCNTDRRVSSINRPHLSCNQKSTFGAFLSANRH